MDIDINEFKERLEKEMATGDTDIAEFIHREIRLTETIKANLMEEMNENTKEFLNNAAARFDTYLFQLQEIEIDMNLKNLTLDQKVALDDSIIRDKIEDGMDELHKMDPEKFPQDGHKSQDEK